MAYEKTVQDFTAVGTDLPESKLSEGFLAGEKPPANWFNSLFNRMTQAIKELQEKSAEKEEISEIIGSSAQKYSYTATIPTTGWSSSAPYTLDILIDGILATDTPDISVVQSSAMSTAQAQLEAWNCINKIETGENKITCTCYESKPTTTIPILIKGVR